VSINARTKVSRGVLLAGLVGVLVVTAVLAVVLSGSSRAEVPTVAPAGDPVPEVAFLLFDGTESTLADFRGRPVVLNFWASWCPACVAEMPSFQAVHETVGDQVLFLGLDVQDTRTAADAFVAQSGVTYLLGEDPDGAILSAFNGIAMPTTVFIDGHGNIVGRHSGAVFEDDLRQMIRELFGI
jgi:thiol-disulfide isomerase/thioredoxin